MTENGRLRRLVDARAALLVFLAFELATIPLFLHWGRRWWFWADDWDFLAARTGGNLGDLFRAHYQHWTTLPILAYRLLWVLFGIRHYVPYQLLLITLHLAAAFLLRAIMVRAGTRPWMATLVAAVFVVFGAGAENILVAFQITFVGALVFGLAQLLLADHDGPIGWRDAWALLAGLAALMCSGVAIAMVLIVGVAMLLRRGWRVALLQTAPLAAAYLVWYTFSPRGPGAGGYHSQSPWQVVQFVGIGIGSAFGRLAQLPLVGILLAVVLVAGFVVAIRRAGLGALRGPLAAPVALLAGAFLFLFVTGLVRSGVPPTLIVQAKGPERARQSRYVYLVAALALPALAIAADALVRRWRTLTIPVVLLLLVGVPGNLHDLSTYANLSAYDRSVFREQLLEAPRLPLADRLPRFVQPAPKATFYGLTLGWLLDSVPSGRIPAPPHVTAVGISTQTLKLAVRRAYVATGDSCERITHPKRVMLEAFQRLTLVSGRIQIEYLPAGGRRSEPLIVQPNWNVYVWTGPFPVEIEPLLQPTRLCGL